ncbi:MAG TPA: L-histidine N(alpha)-methyltransferase [bacterium]|jgi:dimethylhistidine N-methyltransferase
MKEIRHKLFTLYDMEPVRTDVRQDIIEGLSSPRKFIPSKYFYDKRGSELFEQITMLDEYYVTRTELSIMREHIVDIAKSIGPECTLFEFGSGSGIKTHMLLSHMEDPVAFIPIEIEKTILVKSSEKIAESFPNLEVMPVCADFWMNIELPRSKRAPRSKMGYFPGSTLGNFTSKGSLQFLKKAASMCNHRGGLLVGIDLQKDQDVLEAAYNDSKGVTAAFNLNLIRRINYEFRVDIPEEAFEHYAYYNEEWERIEMHLISKGDLDVDLNGHHVHFSEGEHVLTEYSHKYNPKLFEETASEAGFDVEKYWVDEKKYFCIHMLRLR